MASPVHAHVASLNTAAATELCLRSLIALAGCPVRVTVGDCGSTDGSLEMLEVLARAGHITLEVAPGGRAHAAWLDGWLAACDTRWCLFCDSDVEFLRDGWLRAMVAAGEDAGAALVATRIQARGGVPFRHPVTGAMRTLAPRPEPWLMLIDADAVRARIPTSFAYVDEVQPDGTKVAFDTAAAFYRDVVAGGLTVIEMPAGFRHAYHHFGSLSWQRGRGLPLRRVAKQAAKRLWVRLRVARARRRHALSGLRGT